MQLKDVKIVSKLVDKKLLKASKIEEQNKQKELQELEQHEKENILDIDSQLEAQESAQIEDSNNTYVYLGLGLLTVGAVAYWNSIKKEISA